MLNKIFPSFYDELDVQFWGDEAVLLDDEKSSSSQDKVEVEDEVVWETAKQQKPKQESHQKTPKKPPKNQKIGRITNLLKKRGYIIDSTGELFSFVDNNTKNLKIGDRVSFLINNKGTPPTTSSFSKVHGIKKIKTSKPTQTTQTQTQTKPNQNPKIQNPKPKIQKIQKIQTKQKKVSD